MTSLELLKEIETWLGLNTEPSKKEIAKLRMSIKDHLMKQLHISDVCDCDKWHDRMEESNNNCSTCDRQIIMQKEWLTIYGK